MESLPGTYLLILRAIQVQTIPVGRLGMLAVRPGWYVYVGSAFGPGGVRARVGRHLRGDGRLHWHIDYLRQVAAIEEVDYTLDSSPHEHAWAQILTGMPDAEIPLAAFGASDCRCPAHLFFFAAAPDFRGNAIFQGLKFLHISPGHVTG
jgi:Uri superfamily endonuclease